MNKCRSCGAEGETQSLRAPVVFGDNDGQKKFYECRKCGLIYMWPPLDRTEEAKFYAEEFEKFMEVRSGADVDWTGPKRHAETNAENVTRRWEAMKSYCAENSKILEIGCSSGFMLDKFRTERMRPVGVEPSGGFSKYLASKNYEVYRDIVDLPDKYLGHFDIICHFFVLEHVANTRDFIKNQFNLLRPGGVIFCEVPSATDPLTALYTIPKFEEFYWSIAHHYYFTPRSIAYIMEDLGITSYEIIPEQRYDLSNHITWLREGKPGGQGKYSDIFSGALNFSYKQDLINQDFFDTMFLIIRKNTN